MGLRWEWDVDTGDLDPNFVVCALELKWGSKEGL